MTGRRLSRSLPLFVLSLSCCQDILIASCIQSCLVVSDRLINFFRSISADLKCTAVLFKQVRAGIVSAFDFVVVETEAVGDSAGRAVVEGVIHLDLVIGFVAQQSDCGDGSGLPRAVVVLRAHAFAGPVDLTVLVDDIP